MFFSKQPGVRKLLFNAYLLIWVPAFALFLALHLTYNEYLSLVKMSPQSNSESSVVINIMDFESPVSKAVLNVAQPISRLLGHQDTKLLKHSFLRNFQTVWLLSWMSILLLSVGVVSATARKVYKPLNEMRDAINRLAVGDLNQPILIDGSETVTTMSKTLEKMRRRLLDSERNQLQFLRHISHEIKTPLTSIKEGSKLLEDEVLGPISEEQREITTILNKSTAELQGSIENLLNYNSAISINLIKQRQSSKLEELIGEAIKKQALAIRNKHIDIDLRIDEAGIRAFVDASQLTTVFENLLSNAIKFSPYNGVITICVTKTKDGIETTIQDDGPGIPVDQREAVFSAFYVGDQVTKTPLKGTGLGLSIVKEYIELHGGDVKIVNNQESDQTGACFKVRLKR